MTTVNEILAVRNNQINILIGMTKRNKLTGNKDKHGFDVFANGKGKFCALGALMSVEQLKQVSAVDGAMRLHYDEMVKSVFGGKNILAPGLTIEQAMTIEFWHTAFVEEHITRETWLSFLDSIRKHNVTGPQWPAIKSWGDAPTINF